MSIAWNQFTPYHALAGGVLIGLAVTMLLMFNGRIAGISGIVDGLLRRKGGKGDDLSWRWAFVFGLLISSSVAALFVALPESHVDTSWPVLIVAGFLVGLGTRYANGCTSGHGVCGLARFSPRSLAATISFMTAGFVMVYLLRHVFRVAL